MRDIVKVLICFTFFSFTVFAQEYGRGLLLDDSLYVNSPVAAPLMRGDYRDVPSKYSLKAYAPTPGSQGRYSSCAGWSTAYSARTILEAIKKKYSQPDIDSNTFSPSFVYNLIRPRKDCVSGTSIFDALNVIKDIGAAKFSSFGYDCDKEVTMEDEKVASEYKIIEYRKLLGSRTLNKEIFVKKSISNNRPVVIAMNCPISFNRAGDVWYPDSSDYKMKTSDGHSLTVIGYDDNKYDGAFELINSWGTSWGNKGFTWMRYSDFQIFCVFAFEILDKSIPAPGMPDLSGSLKFSLADESIMNTRYEGKVFTMQNKYPAGTLFKLEISNNEPAYVYSFGSDNTCKIQQLFPFSDKMLAYLPYTKNNIAIPDDDHYNMIDSTGDTSYYCFLYSRSPLDINEIASSIENGSGEFKDRFYKAIETLEIDKTYINFSDGAEIKFKAVSNGKNLVPVLVEIERK